MLPLFLSRLLILYQLLGRVLTAPTHYLQKKKNKKKSLLRFVTMKGNLVVCVRWKLPPGQAHGAAATARGWDRLVPNVPNYAVNVWLCDPALSFSKLGPTSGTSRPRCAFMQPPVPRHHRALSLFLLSLRVEEGDAAPRPLVPQAVSRAPARSVGLAPLHSVPRLPGEHLPEAPSPALPGAAWRGPRRSHSEAIPGESAPSTRPLRTLLLGRGNGWHRAVISALLRGGQTWLALGGLAEGSSSSFPWPCCSFTPPGPPGHCELPSCRQLTEPKSG